MKRIHIIMFSMLVLVAYSTFGKSSENENNDVTANIPFEIINNDTYINWEKSKTPEYKWLKSINREEKGVSRFDSETRTYVRVSSGVKPSGMYQLVLKEIREEGKKIIIIAEDIPPQSNQATADMVYPTLILSLDKREKPIEFLWY
jgi:hypothetical protein